MPTSKTKRNALILSGGGARGAYQAGVLRGLSKIFSANKPRISVITGVSAGAINAAYLGANLEDLDRCTENLWNFWAGLSPDDIYQTNLSHLAANSFRLAKNFTLGAWKADLNERNLGLLNPEPLRKLLKEKIDFQRIEENLQNHHLDVLALSTFDYDSRLGITYYQSREKRKAWERAYRRALPGVINQDHVMASAAIPMFFPAQRLDNRFHGDGCLRNTAPLSPAIRLGADRLLIIGVRQGLIEDIDLTQATKSPSWGQIISTLISSIFFDGLEMDLERLDRINRNLRLECVAESNTDSDAETNHGAAPLREIESLYIHPSKDIAEIASKYFNTLPKSLRLLFRTFGASEDSGDLISYFLFEKEFCEELLVLGEQDILEKEEKVLKLYS